MSAAGERVIRARGAWLRVDLARLFHYRDLLWILVRRDFVARYQQTILGPAWFVLQPLLMTAVFWAVFARGLRTGTDGVPPFLFYLCGMLVWGYFSAVLNGTSNTFGANAAMFGKVYFPRVIVPAAAAISNLIALAVQVATFLIVYIGHLVLAPAARAAIQPDWVALSLLPLLLAQTALFALGAGLLLSALSAKYRDLQHAIPLVVQLWLFATPIIYPLSQLGPKAQWFAALNPLTTIVETFRLGFFGVGTVAPGPVGFSVGVTLVVLLAGFAAFQQVERTVVDTV